MLNRPLPYHRFSPVPTPLARSYLCGHAKQRAKERYCLNLSDEDIEQIRDTIMNRSARAIHLKDIGDFRRSVAVKMGKVWLLAVWDDATKTIVTFLPEWRLEEYRHYLMRANFQIKKEEARKRGKSNGMDEDHGMDKDSDFARSGAPLRGGVPGDAAKAEGKENNNDR